MRPDRVVIGAESRRAESILRKIHDPLFLIETPMVVTTLETAELIKYAANAFLATKVSFINEMANVCEQVGADVQVLAKAIGMDRRIGPKFLHAGPGYGGSCFPKDTLALASFARAARDPHAHRGGDGRRQRERRWCEWWTRSSARSGRRAARRWESSGSPSSPTPTIFRAAPALTIIAGLRRRRVKVKVSRPGGAWRTGATTLRGVEFAEDAYDAGLMARTRWSSSRSGTSSAAWTWPGCDASCVVRCCATSATSMTRKTSRPPVCATSAWDAASRQRDAMADGVDLERARVLVTGGAGFIGSNLVRHLLALPPVPRRGPGCAHLRRATREPRGTGASVT